MDKKDFLKKLESLVLEKSVFTGFSDAQYNTFYQEKILPITEFLRIDPVEGSAPWVLNLEGNQEEFIDFAEKDLLRMQDECKADRLFVPDLVKKIEEWYKVTNDMMYLILGTIKAGTEAIENRIEQQLEAEQKKGFREGVEKYYVKRYSRDKTLLGRIDGKLSTVEQMKKAAYIGDGWILAQSVWPGIYKDSYKRYLLKERVGFDKCFLNVSIEEIDSELFFEAIRKYENKKTYPRINVVYIKKSDNDNENDKRPVKLPLENNCFQEIKVEFSSYVLFSFKRNNGGLEGKDIYLLRIYVKPDINHPYLGNVRNYSMCELQDAVKEACWELKEKTGIVCDYKKITLNNVELNVTFVEDGDFDKIINYVSFYQLFLRPEYKTNCYVIPKKDFEIYGEDESYKKMHMVSTGYTSKSSTIQIKLYDKKEETLEFVRSKKKKARFELDGKALVRLEYVLSHPYAFRRFFREIVVCNMTQEDIEEAYRDLTKHFFIEPYEKKFVPASKKTLKKLLEKAAMLASRKNDINSGKKRRNWRVQLVKDILSEEIWVKTTPALINENDINKEIIPSNSTFSRRPGQYIEEIRNLLKESDIYKKDQPRAYDRLYNFFRKTGELEGLSTCRRIGYAIMDEKKWVERDIEIAEKEAWLRGIIGDYYNPNMV